MEKKIGNSIFGKRNVREYIKKKLSGNDRDWSVKEVLVKKNPSKDIIEEILNHIPQKIKISYLSQGDLDSLLPGKNHQGIVLLNAERAQTFNYKNFEDLLELLQLKKEPILVLDRILDTGNLGNILRTAECFGIKHIIVPERDMAPINDTVLRISSGAVYHLNIYRVVNLKNSLEKLKSFDYWIAITSDQGNEDWSNLPPKENLVIVLGNEEKGVKRLIHENSDYQLRIPLHGSISSLNVTVSCGIILDRIINMPENRSF